MAVHLRSYLVLFLLSAFVSFVGVALAADLVVEGRVYCDTCRAGFETNVTEYLEGAKVKLQCRNSTTGAITLTENGLTDNNGTYRIKVSGDHHNEACQVILLRSSRNDCSEISEDRNEAPIMLTGNVGGSTGNVRKANPLGYLVDEPLPACGHLLMQHAKGADG